MRIHSLVLLILLFTCAFLPGCASWYARQAEEDALELRTAGVRRVYTPKDFDLTRIMGEIVDVVTESPAAH